MKTVFILGAGASRAAGAPLMFDFIDCANRILRRGEATWAHKNFESSLDARRKLQNAYVKSNVDLDNIETLFSTYEMAALIGRLGNFDEKVVESLPISLRYVIMRTLEQSILYPLNSSDSWIPAPYPYDAFVELLLALQRHRDYAPVAVVNFNYDLCLDYALALQSVESDYGLPNQSIEGKKRIPHYKVHGSLNWFRDEATGSIGTITPRPLSMARYWERLGLNEPADRPIDTMELLHGPDMWGHDLHPEPIIVPPTWNKGWYQQQLRSVWRAAASALASAENVFVIGYSLPPSDQFFRAFWSLSTMSDSVVDRFWLFDPSTDGAIVSRFRSMLGPAITERGKFRHEPLKFTGALQRIAKEASLPFFALPDR